MKYPALKIGLSILVLIWVMWLYALPSSLFNESWSTVVTDNQGRIIGIRVAKDGQYRFSYEGKIPKKYFIALQMFEDRRFMTHNGVDWIAFMRALKTNIMAGHVVQGGSTITMQVIRMMRKNPSRTYLEKIKEVWMASRLELTYSKNEILYLYASHAPFGGNIVGVRAAAYKYFGCEPDELSWAEAALLAVLPNAPSLRNKERLQTKRNQLLLQLHKAGYISEEDYKLALMEDVPSAGVHHDDIIPHLTDRLSMEKRDAVSSTIDIHLQRRVNEIVARHSALLSHNRIFNMAVLVAHIPTGEVRAYVGNSPACNGSDGNQVDIITAQRSSGSILKPVLYSLSQRYGFILPTSLIADVPISIDGYAPSNFSRNFIGAVPADKALAMSLNIPFVLMLRDYGYSRFYGDLKKMGITTLSRIADNYGLSLILGGAETSLWDLCNMYGGMVSTLQHYNRNDGTYFSDEYRRLHVVKGDTVSQYPITDQEAPLTASSLWLTLKAMEQLERPDMESGWKHFVSRINLAWKTGTSFGFRDAWAVGVNSEWVVGVWVGNATGEGRPGLIGVRCAAPILFEIASQLPKAARFEKPVDELKRVVICRHSGFRASLNCVDCDTIEACDSYLETEQCPYCRKINLDKSHKWQVTSDVESVYNMDIVSWFVLPPVQEWYYSRSHTDYKPLPPYREDCRPLSEDAMEIIYPRKGTSVFIPRDFGGKKCQVVLEVAHRRSDAIIYWHINDVYIGNTQYYHQMPIDLVEGSYILTLIDENGVSVNQRFKVVSR